MARPKKPTLKEKVEVYEAIFHRINFHRNLTMNEAAIKRILELMDGWSWAHRSGNGERSMHEEEDHINLAFEKFKNLP